MHWQTGNIVQTWQDISAFAWHEDMPDLVLMVVLIGALLLRLKPVDRRSVMVTLLVFLFSLCGLLASGAVNGAGFPKLAEGLREAFFLLEGMAVIRLWGMLLFRLALPLLRLTPPRILEDLLVFVGYIALGIVRLHYAGLELSGIVTTSAVITAVIAFSMQDTLGNVLGGLALQLDNSIEIGDWIKVDDVSGKVVEIRWRYTAIATRNWETIVIPNSLLMKAKFAVLGRHSEEEPIQWRRWVWFNVGYQAPPAKVIDTVQKALHMADIPNVSRLPEPNCVLMDFEASYGRYAVRYWLTDLALDDPTDSEVRDHIYTALQRAGIRLAVPEHKVRMTKENEKHEQAKQMRRTHERVEALHKVELFNTFHEDELLAIAERLKYAPFAKGDVITHQGAVAHWLYMLINGEADVFMEMPGQEKRKLSTLRPGSFFGEMGLMTGAPRTATVIATEDAECYQLDKASFQEVLLKRPELADEISTILVSRRYGLDSMQPDLDAETRVQEMTLQHQDILARIRGFFGLKAA